MGGFLGTGQEAREQAVVLGRTLALPLAARSLTAAEVARIDGRAVPLMLGIYFAVAVPIVAIAAFDGSARSGHTLLLVVPLALLLGAALWLLAQARARRRSSYEDPQIVVEVREEALVLRSPGRVETLAYADAPLDWIVYRQKGVTHFRGLKLDSPFGLLLLDDTAFIPGRDVAAAIAARADALRILPAIGE